MNHYRPPWSTSTLALSEPSWRLKANTRSKTANILAAYIPNKQSVQIECEIERSQEGSARREHLCPDSCGLVNKDPLA